MAASSSAKLFVSSSLGQYAYEVIERRLKVPEKAVYSTGLHYFYSKNNFFYTVARRSAPDSVVKAHLSLECKGKQSVLASAWNTFIPIFLKHQDITDSAKIIDLNGLHEGHENNKTIMKELMEKLSRPEFKLHDMEMDTHSAALVQYEYDLESVKRNYEKEFKIVAEQYERFSNGAHITIYFTKHSEAQYDKHQAFFTELNNAFTKANIPCSSTLPKSDFPVKLCPFASLRIDKDEKAQYILSENYNKFDYADHPYFRAMVSEEMLVKPKEEIVADSKEEKVMATPVQTIDFHLYLRRTFDKSVSTFWQGFNSTITEAYDLLNKLFDPSLHYTKSQVLSEAIEIASIICDRKEEIPGDVSVEDAALIMTFFESLATKNWNNMSHIMDKLKDAIDNSKKHSPTPTASKAL